MRHWPTRPRQTRRRVILLLWGLVSGMVIVPHTATAQCTMPSALKDGDFAGQRGKSLSLPWVAEGSAGIASGHAWAGNKPGWNALRQELTLSAGVTYTLTATVRTSPDLGAQNGDLGFHDGTKPVAHRTFGPLKDYTDWSVRFRPDRTGPYKVYIGFVDSSQNTDARRRRDQWIEVEQMRLDPPLHAGCDDVRTKPVN